MSESEAHLRESAEARALAVVARIRRENNNQRGYGHVTALAMEAADEIDRLLAALAERDRYIAIQEGITS